MIHWTGIPKGVCERKDTSADVVVTKIDKGSITNLAVADHRANVSCPVCLRAMRHPTLLRRIRELNDIVDRTWT